MYTTMKIMTIKMIKMSRVTGTSSFALPPLPFAHPLQMNGANQTTVHVQYTVEETGT